MEQEDKEQQIEDLPVSYDRAEECLLGIMMQDDDAAAWSIQTILQPKHFKTGKNKKLFEIVRSIKTDGGSTSLAEVCERAEKTMVGQTEKTYLDTIGSEYIGKVFATPEDLSEGVGIKRARAYIKAILEQYKLRELIKIFDQAKTKKIYDKDFFANKIQEANTLITTEEFESEGLVDGVSLLASANQRFKDRRANPELAKPIPSGFPSLDLCKVLLPRRLIVLGGETSVGKTLFGINIISRAIKSSKVSLYYTTEIDSEELMDRFICGETKIYATGWKEGIISDEEYSRFSDFSTKFLQGEATNIHVDSKGQDGLFSIDYILNSIRTHQVKQKVDLVIVDYLQKLDFKGGREIRLDVMDAMRRFYAFAKVNDLTIIVVSQLNRSKDKENSWPTLKRLSESGAIEQFADAVLLIHRTSRTNVVDRKKAFFAVAKNNRGITKDWTPMRFDERYLLFIEDESELPPQIDEDISVYSSG